MKKIKTTDQKIKIRAMTKTMLGGVNNSTVYRWIKTQGFPRPIKLSPCCSVWCVHEIEEWIESRERLHTGEVA